MSFETLVLKPDPIKGRLGGIGLPAVIGTAIAAVVLVIVQEFRLGIFAYLAVAAILCAYLVWLMASERPDERIELRSDGLAVVTEKGRRFFRWRDLSRFTLLEEVSRSADDEIKARSHFLAARLVTSTMADASSGAAPDAATSERNADLLIPIDVYISHHRYSGRSAKQEAACRSPEDLADTVNAWRDFALNLEIRAVPTPILQMESGSLASIVRKL